MAEDKAGTALLRGSISEIQPIKKFPLFCKKFIDAIHNCGNILTPSNTAMKSSASSFTIIQPAAVQGLERLWNGGNGAGMAEVRPCGYRHLNHLNHLNHLLSNPKTRDERSGFQGLT